MYIKSMNIREAEEKVFIKAQNAQECDIVSALLQDSIFEIFSCDYLKNEKCFRLILNRFCWEHSHKFSDERCYHRVHSGLYIHNVRNIKTNSFFKNRTVPYLNLLAVHASDSEVNLVFSDKKHMYLEVDGILVYLKDLHAKYPTNVMPGHRIG